MQPSLSQKRRGGGNGYQNAAGILVLALGLLAVAGMGYWAYSLYGTPEAAQEEETPAVPEAKPAQDEVALEGLDTAQPATEAQLQGLWEAPFANGERAVLAFQNGTYQTQLAEKAPSFKRLYAIGTYTLSPSGLMTLQPKPGAQPEAVTGMSYENLTVRRYEIEAKFNPQTGRLFLAPHIKPGMNDQVHPLFFHVGANAETGWTKRTQ